MNSAASQDPAGRSLSGILLSVSLHAALFLGFGHALRPLSPLPNARQVQSSAPMQVMLLRAPLSHHYTTQQSADQRSDAAVVVPDLKPLGRQDAGKSMEPDTTPEPVATMASLSPLSENVTQSAPADPRNLTPENKAAHSASQTARPDYAYNPAPEYPMVLREHGLGGTVWLRVWVDSEGRPSEVKLAKGSGYRLFDEAALRVVALWRFIPAQVGEQKFASWVEFPIRFTLNG